MSAFDEIYEQTATFVPTEEWLESQGDNWEALAETPIEGDDKPIKTIGQAHMSIEVDFSPVPMEVMAYVFGVDRYMDEYGQHRIHNVNHWEYKTFDKPVGFMFNSLKFKHTPVPPLCPIGLGAG